MTELSASFREAWERFQRADSVRLLQETLEWEWTKGRKEYAAFLIQIEDESARELIARTIEEIADIPGVDPYPETYWHITVKGIGFVVDEPGQADEVSPRQVADLGARARRIVESSPEFTVSAARPNAFPEVVMLEVEDEGGTRTLNERLYEELPDLPQYSVDGAAHLPHISIARFSSHEGLPQLKETLARLRAVDASTASFTVREVGLIQAHLAEAAPTFDTLASYRLSREWRVESGRLLR